MTKHTPVLLQEVIDNLKVRPGETLLDGTLGGGGHCEALARSVGGDLNIVGLDRDGKALERSRERLELTGARVFLFQESFRNLDKILSLVKEPIPSLTGFDAILLDLGISSDQLDSPAGGPGKGFSFQTDEPLDMRMSEEGITAADILNTFSEEALELIIRGFGEERYSVRIAKEIVERREKKPLKTTFELRDAILAAVPGFYQRGRLNPATRTFQAIRIAVNEELTALEEGLEKGFRALSVGGRLAVISFHSLEDRIVKNFFRELARQDLVSLVTKKPIVPSEEEKLRNPRSRSAKLRIIRKNS